MANVFTSKILAEGQLASSTTTVYTVPGSTTTSITSARFNNRGSTIETIELWVRPSSTDRRIARVILDPGETLLLTDDDIIILEAGDLFRANTTNATTVDYVICGVEES